MCFLIHIENSGQYWDGEKWADIQKAKRFTNLAELAFVNDAINGTVILLPTKDENV